MEQPDNDERNHNTVSVQEIANKLITAITTGQFSPGQRLVELQLCELFNVKRSKVREALRKLEHDGFVKIKRNVGAVVSRFSRRDIEEVYDLLAMLDGLAVRIATPFITSDQLKRLEEIIDKMESTDDPALFNDLNNNLHTLIELYCENRRLIKATEVLRLNIPAFGFSSFFAPGQIAASVREHRQIVKAIKDGKGEMAEKMMRDHIVNAKNRLIKWMYKSL